ncbi:MAG: pyridoxal phosphate-dependent aminotransferase [Patescibacteria group bacterium]|nr:pyridoxal phosphate-dependent aminotransferase [Patescibacteria group bacterium]
MQKRLSISNRGHNAPPSPVRKLVPFAESAKVRGIKVYHVNIGDPDFEAPKEILNTLKNITQMTKRVPYANSKGLKQTVESWKTYYADIGIVLKENDFLITNGGSEGLLMVAAALLDPGEEFIVFEPFYANYLAYANFVSAKVVPVALDPKNGYHLPSKNEIVKKITSKTKALFFINPNNPSGTVFTKDEIRMLLDVAVEHNLFLVSDETYLGMTFDKTKSYSVLHVAKENEKNHCIVVDSVSKKLNMCGARVGVVVSTNSEVMDSVFRFAQGRLSVPYIEQEMVAPMLSDCLEYVAWLAKQYEARRNAFLATLEKKLGTKIHKPEGAFYAMVQLPVDDIEEFAKWLLTDFQDNNETVMVAPGPGFYATAGKGMNEARVAYVLNEKDLERAAELLALAVKKYTSKK